MLREIQIRQREESDTEHIGNKQKPNTPSHENSTFFQVTGIGNDKSGIEPQKIHAVTAVLNFYSSITDTGDKTPGCLDFPARK